jgi:RNA polymerase sigma-70 factor (sigma-E family)
MGSRDEEFVAYYRARGVELRNTAYLLCGDWHLAEDLTQITFTKLYRAWRRIERHDVLDQFARRVLLRAFLDERRRPWGRVFATGPHSATLDTVTQVDATPGDPGIAQALQRLPKRMRAVLIMRFWADLPVDQVADLLGCSPGTVKSSTSRGLASLRTVLGTDSTSPGGRT